MGNSRISFLIYFSLLTLGLNEMMSELVNIPIRVPSWCTLKLVLIRQDLLLAQ